MTQHPDHIISWFEIPATDFDRAVEFYETLLDVTLIHESMDGNLLGVFPFKDGQISGCVLSGAKAVPSETGTVIYLKALPNLQTVLSRVDDAGGLITKAATPLPSGKGVHAQIIDSEGNRIGLFSYA